MQSQATSLASVPSTANTWFQAALASLGSIFHSPGKQEESESDAISGWVGERRRRCRSVGEAR
ncbi:hypothetical protein N7457_001487 [Penicillium paradoxum]|uniref:uncharacterized protein n=1 Tax=Penicillium paradoxum TaxID=176176 RepID=UPI00254948F2|nr:uncharacterized protein N7457_001487 [Penicillium paradoxum]KAJ5794888.1 hypothetical protein N7457_001487 [Penicillium paradoxum]